jgi:large conductance mechanosensitive channel
MVKEFMGFLKQYGIIGLAIAVIIGGKLNELIKTVVDGLLMPIIGLITPGGDWRTLAWTVESAGGKTVFLYGPILGSTLDFVIVAGIIFLFAKMVLKEQEVAKR